MIIGLCGQKGSGKSTLAKQLEQKLLYWRFAFAEPIKQATATMLRLQGVFEEEIYRLVWGEGKEEECKYFNGASNRKVQRTLGEEWGKTTIDQNLWIGMWERSVAHHRRASPSIYKNIVVEDVRFLNEAEIIRHHSGKIIRIERGHGEIDDHISELEHLRITPDLVIRNNSTPEHMLQQLLVNGILDFTDNDPFEPGT